MVEKYPNLTLPKLKHLSRHTVTQHRHASKVNSHGNGSSNFTPIFPNRTENNLSKNTWNKMAATVPSHPRWHLLWQRNTYETLQQQLRKMKEQFFGLCVHVKRFNGINYFWEKKDDLGPDLTHLTPLCCAEQFLHNDVHFWRHVQQINKNVTLPETSSLKTLCQQSSLLSSQSWSAKKLWPSFYFYLL